MTDEALAQLIAGLRANGPDFTAPPAAGRAAFEALLATLPVAGDLSFVAETLGGVPGLRAASPGAAADRALLYLHGGAYVMGSAQGYRGLAGELGRAAGMTAYAVDYRLAPEHPFPAAVQDGVAAYRALLARGLSPSRIAIAGDSAGGGLTLATLVAARDASLPLPGAGLLISPWADLACEGGSIVTKAAEDPSLNRAGLAAGAARYLAGRDPRDPLASPIHARLERLPPLLIQVGSAEILLDDAVRVAGAAGAAGVATRLEVWPEMIHVWHAFAFLLRAGREAIAAAGGFLRRHTGGAA